MTSRAHLPSLLLLLTFITGCGAVSSKIERVDVPVEMLPYESWYWGGDNMRGRAFAMTDGSYLFLRRNADPEYVLERYLPDFSVDMKISVPRDEDDVFTGLIRQGDDFSLLSIREDDDRWEVYGRQVDLTRESISEPTRLFACREEMEDGVYTTFSPDSSRILLYALGEVNYREGDRRKNLWSRPLEGVILNSALQVVDSFHLTVPYAQVKKERVIYQALPTNDGKLLFITVQYGNPGYLVSSRTYTGSSDKPVSTLEGEVPLKAEEFEDSSPGGMTVVRDGTSNFGGLLSVRDGDNLTGLFRVRWDLAKGTVDVRELLVVTEELASQLTGDDELEDLWPWGTTVLDDGSLLTIPTNLDYGVRTRVSDRGHTRYFPYTEAGKSVVLSFNAKDSLVHNVLIDRDDSGPDDAIGRLEGPFIAHVEGRTLRLLMHRQESGELILYTIDLDANTPMQSKTLLKLDKGVIVPRETARWFKDGSIMLVLKQGLRSADWVLTRLRP